MIINYKYLIIILFLFAVDIVVVGAVSPDTSAPENFPVQDTVSADSSQIMDMGDIFRRLFLKGHKPKKHEKKVVLLILPDISYNPTNGLLLGISGNLEWAFGNRNETRPSLLNFNAAYTSENQLLTFIKSNVYTKDNMYFLEGDWRFNLYRSSTFGLGTNSPDSDFDGHLGWQEAPVNEASGGYPMKYNFAIFHQIVNRKVHNNIYLGIGYHLDIYWEINDLNLNLDTIPLQITPHYGYSLQHGYDPSGYVLSGFSLNAMFDSRDNQVNAYKGYYAKLNYRYNPKFLGSDENSSELWAEFRTYVGLSKKIPRHLIAFWLFGNFQTTGNMPYYTLMSLADDQKSRSGRGYVGGRYRGENLLYGEIEYRFPILKRKQTLGGVVFLNAVTATNKFSEERLFDYVRPAMGVGLRILMNKVSRMNICIDFGIGFKSDGIYFAGTEAF
jgi:outer membrane protein assembly factor BamA